MVGKMNDKERETACNKELGQRTMFIFIGVAYLAQVHHQHWELDLFRSLKKIDGFIETHFMDIHFFR